MVLFKEKRENPENESLITRALVRIEDLEKENERLKAEAKKLDHVSHVKVEALKNQVVELKKAKINYEMKAEQSSDLTDLELKLSKLTADNQDKEKMLADLQQNLTEKEEILSDLTEKIEKYEVKIAEDANLRAEKALAEEKFAQLEQQMLAEKAKVADLLLTIEHQADEENSRFVEEKKVAQAEIEQAKIEAAEIRQKAKIEYDERVKNETETLRNLQEENSKETVKLEILAQQAKEYRHEIENYKAQVSEILAEVQGI